MEIIHIILGKANPDRLNGVNKVVYHLASEQHKAGKKVQVWGITQQPIHDYPERNFKTELFRAERFPFAINQELKKAVLAKPEAVYHLHGGWVPVFSSLAALFKGNKIKFVLTPHGAYNTIAMQRSGRQKRIYFHLFEKQLLKHVHKVHAIGISEVEGLRSICPKAQSFLLPYGFDRNHHQAHASKSESFVIGFVGRLDTHTKGLDLLMDAFKNFSKGHPDAELWIIGEGEGKAYLQKFIQDHQLKNIWLMGKKFGREKDLLISQMHVFAHPSRNEGLPTAVLEAAALGTPVLVTSATNVASYVNQYHAGISVDTEDAIALAGGMETLFQSYRTGESSSLIQGADKMLQQVFSWPVLVEQYDELYK